MAAYSNIITDNIILGYWDRVDGVNSVDVSRKHPSTVAPSELTVIDQAAKKILEKYGQAASWTLAAMVSEIKATDATEEQLSIFMRSAVTKDFSSLPGSIEGTGFPEVNRQYNATGDEYNIFSRRDHGFPRGTLFLYDYIRRQVDPLDKTPGTNGNNTGEFAATDKNLVPNFQCVDLGTKISKTPSHVVAPMSKQFGFEWRKNHFPSDAPWGKWKFTMEVKQYRTHHFVGFARRSLHNLFMRNYYGHFALLQNYANISSARQSNENMTNPIQYPDAVPQFPVRSKDAQPVISLYQEYYAYRLALAGKFHEMIRKWKAGGKPTTWPIGTAGGSSFEEYLFWFWYSIYDPILLEGKANLFNSLRYGQNNNPAYKNHPNADATGVDVFPFADYKFRNETEVFYNEYKYNQYLTHTFLTATTPDALDAPAATKTGSIESMKASTSLPVMTDYLDARGHAQSNNDVSAFIRAVLNHYQSEEWGHSTSQIYFEKVLSYVGKLSKKDTKLSYDHRDLHPYIVGASLNDLHFRSHWTLTKTWSEHISGNVPVPSTLENASGMNSNLLASFNLKTLNEGANATAKGGSWDAKYDIRKTGSLRPVEGGYPIVFNHPESSWAYWGYVDKGNSNTPFISSAPFAASKPLSWHLISGLTLSGAQRKEHPPDPNDPYMFGTEDVTTDYMYNRPNAWGEGYRSMTTMLAQMIHRGSNKVLKLKQTDSTTKTLNFSSMNSVAEIASSLYEKRKVLHDALFEYYNQKATTKRDWKEMFVSVPMKDTQVRTYINTAYTKTLGSGPHADWRSYVDRTYDEYTTLWKDMHTSELLFKYHKEQYAFRIGIHHAAGGISPLFTKGKEYEHYYKKYFLELLDGSDPGGKIWSFPYTDPPITSSGMANTFREAFNKNNKIMPGFTWDNVSDIKNKEHRYAHLRWNRTSGFFLAKNYAEKSSAFVSTYLDSTDPAYTPMQEYLGDVYKTMSDQMTGPGRGETYADWVDIATKGAESGLDVNFWNRGFTEEFSHTIGDKIEFPSTKPDNDQVLENCAASAAVQIVAALGQAGTQNYLNSIMAAYLYDGAVSEDDFEAAEADATGALPKLASPELQTFVLSEDEVEARQEFFEQCALLMTMDRFTAAHRNRIKTEIVNVVNKNQTLRSPHGAYAYNKRLWMLEDISIPTKKSTNSKYTDQNGMINKFFIPHNLEEFMNIPPSVAAMLVPKLRIYKVYEASVANKPATKQVEFEFDQEGLGGGFIDKNNNTTAVERIDQMFSNKTAIDRGNGAGIKSFDFSFEGTSPATARNDITASLVLYFQNFNDFFRKRVNNAGEEFSFVDMILYPGKKVGYGKAAKNQYDPSYYRIRVDVGWQTPDGMLAEIEKTYGTSGSGSRLVEQIRQINKSFYLNMIDHDIDIKEDGSVEIKISYRAYLESLMKTTRMDALESLEIRKEREKKEKKLNKAREENCPDQEIISLKNEFMKQEEILAALSQQSIMQRLFANQRIYWAELHESSKKQFEKAGFFTTRPYFYKKHELAKEGVKRKFGAAKSQTPEAKAYGKLVRENLQDEEGLINFNFVEDDIGRNQRIHYFFMGDLVYTVLDCLYGKETKVGVYDYSKYRDTTVENIKVLLGSFDYYDFDGNRHVANIANIPISAHYFVEWFTQNVVKPKRTGYPVIYFIRDLCNQLVGSLFGNLCRRTPLERKIRFNTGNFIAPGEQGPSSSGKYVDRFEKLSARFKAKGQKWTNNGKVVINVHDNYIAKQATLPLMSDVGNNLPISDNYNYLLIYAIQTPTITHPGEGNMADDKLRGVQHFHIGSRQGITKKINFSKTDIQYIRESRFLNHGDQGLLQLGAVYKVTIQTIGNTIWYPGMEVYINPLGIGGTEFGYPQDIKSRANALGIGGYHIVTRVKNSIAAGKFNTTIEAQFHYSGAPQDSGQQLGVGYQNSSDTKNLEAKNLAPNAECADLLQTAAEETSKLRSKAGIRNIED